MRKALTANGIYAIGSLANSAALFLLIPFLVNNLTVDEYGAWSLLEIGILLFVMLALPGLETALMRKFWSIEGDQKRIQLNSTLFWFVMIWGGFLVLVGSGLAILFSASITIPGSPVTIILALLAGHLEALVGVLLTIFRVREEAWKFSSLSILRMIVFIIGSMILIWDGRGLTGAVLGRVIAGVIAIVVGISIGFRNFAWSFSWSSLLEMARYGLPLLPTKGAQYVLQASDRFVLRYFTDLSVVGIYSFAYKIAAGLDILIIRPFAIDWGARRFKIETYADPSKHYARILLIYTGISLFTALILLSIVPELYELLAPESYKAGMAVVPVILAAYVVYGLAYPLNIGMMVRDKTVYAPIIGGIATIACIVLNLVLIPRFGMVGAAWATLISYVIWTGGITLVSQYFYRVEYRFKEIFLLIVGTIIGYGGIWWIDQIGLGTNYFLLPILIKFIWVLLIFLPIVYSILRMEGIRFRSPKFISPDRSI
jgi:O-antigen/teichoic acid export membrane protein